MGKACGGLLVKNQGWQNIHIRFCVPFPFDQEKPGIGLVIFSDKLKTFRFNSMGAHRTDGVSQPFGTLTQTQPSAAFEQPCCRGTDVVNRTQHFMPGDPVGSVSGQDAGSTGFVGRVAGDEVKSSGRQAVPDLL